MTQSSSSSCVFCTRTGNVLAKCIKFTEKTVQDRVKFVQAEKLCFGFLKTGHHSRRSDNQSTRERCQKRHPTCLHDDKFQEHKRMTTPKGDSNSENKADTPEIAAMETTNRVMQESLSTQTSSIIPVWVSSTKQPTQRSRHGPGRTSHHASTWSSVVH